MDFTYEALLPNGDVTRGELSAENEIELEERLRDLGQYLIRAEARAAAARTRTDAPVRPQELIAFTEYLFASVQVGLPLLTALSDAEVRLTGTKIRAITREIAESVGVEGRSLSEALAEHPRTFPELYVAIVEAGEATGRLEFALERLLEYMDWQQEIRSQIRQATLYPLIVFLAMVMLILILITFVYPKLLPILTQFDVTLPLPTRILIGVTEFVRGFWFVVLGAIGGIVAGIWLIRKSSRGRRLTDWMLLRVPIFGRLMHEINMARFVTYLALFYRTGVGLIQGLQLVERIMANRVLADAVGAARERIERGDSIAEAFQGTKLFPPLVVRSLALGETTGRLDDALMRSKVYYDRELPTTVKRLLAALQPTLILMLGGVILLVGLSIILPILSIYQSISP